MPLSVLIVSLVSIAVIALICALVAHKFVADYWRANIFAVLYTLFIFHGVTYLEAGSIDPNWPISSIIVSAVAVSIAILVGKFRQLKQTP